MNDRKQFTQSLSGKIRQLGCPYEGIAALAKVVELTAIEYVQGDRCLCSYCWANREEYRWVNSAVWEEQR